MDLVAPAAPASPTSTLELEFEDPEALAAAWDQESGYVFDYPDDQDPSAVPESIVENVPLGECASLNVETVCGVTSESVKAPLGEEVSKWPNSTKSFVYAGGPLTPAEKAATKEEFWAKRVGEFNKLEEGRARQDSSPPPPPLQPDPAPDPQRRFDRAAARHGCDPAFLEYALNGNCTYLRGLETVPISNDTGDRREASHIDRARLTRPIPQPAAPALQSEGAPPSIGRPLSELDKIDDIFRDKFPFRAMFLDPDDVLKRIAEWESRFREDSLRCQREAENGRVPKSKFREVLVIGIEEFHEDLRWRHINCDDHTECFIVTGADEEQEAGTGLNHANMRKDLEGDTKFTDKVILDHAQFGLDTKSTQPWGIVLAPFNASAAPRLGLVEDTMDKGQKKGWQVMSPTIPAVPYIAEPHSIVYKKHSLDPNTGTAKPRLATDKSFFPGNKPVVDPQTGTDFADNKNVDIANFPKMTLVTDSKIRDALGTLDVMADEVRANQRFDPSQEVSQAAWDSAGEEAGQVYMGCEDFASYFNQFLMRAGLQTRQGLCFTRRSGELVHTYSRRCQFGGATAPQFSQRFTNSVLYQLQKEMCEEEARWARDAEAYERDPSTGSAFAALMSPPALRELVHMRSECLGVDPYGTNNAAALPFFVEGYIDDIIIAGLGKMRTMVILSHLWAICDRWNIPVAEGKGSFGTKCEVIGYLFSMKARTFSLTDNKRHLLAAWFRRLRGLRGRTIETKELASLAGTLVWCRSAIPQSGHFLRRMFGLSNVKRRRIYQPKWLQFDLDQLEDVFAEDDGVHLIQTAPPPATVEPRHMLWSDASRELKGNTKSAMGGLIPAAGVVWKYTFSQHQVEELPIHVLEGIGSITGLAMAAESARSQPVLAWCDNQSWTKSVQRGAPKDPCLRELMAVQNRLCENYQLQLFSDYVPTDINTVADAASRDDMEGAIQHLRDKGWGKDQITVLDLNLNPEAAPHDLELLFERMIQLQKAKVAVRKGKNQHLWGPTEEENGGSED